MLRIPKLPWRMGASLVLVGTVFMLFFSTVHTVPTFAAGTLKLQQLSSDPYTNRTSNHRTEIEPDTYAYGTTIVAAYQAGRFFDGGSSNNGWATSADSGHTWKYGFLPGTTRFAGGPYDRISDPTIVYDARHHTWLFSSLAILQTKKRGLLGAAVVVNRSTDGGFTWSKPVSVAKVGPNDSFDKDWITCDNSATSRFYGHCYSEWDDNARSGLIQMSTSTDGVIWTAQTVIPIDPGEKNAIYFIPGLAVDRATSGQSTYLGLVFYYVFANCTQNCGYRVGFVSSNDNGATWSKRMQLAGTMLYSWFPTHSNGNGSEKATIPLSGGGNPVGDYIAASFVGGRVFPVFSVAYAPSGGHFNEAMYTVADGISV